MPGLTGEPLDVSWRPLVTGQRVTRDISLSDRVLASLEGNLIAGTTTPASRIRPGARSSFTGGYVIDARMIDGVGSGLLNPFGDQTAALSTAFLQDSLLRGQFLKARINSSAIDFKASRDMMAMGGGQLGFAIGGELRHDKATYTVDRALA
ncbi:hypothetical protein LP419_09865 [Massilia sp. H-1]|nr:hypothetical protein LP419_09865 [Massilia sp. H-1]